MRVDNRVNQPPPARPRDNEATSRSANNGPNRTQAELPALPNRTRGNTGGPPQIGNSHREVGVRVVLGYRLLAGPARRGSPRAGPAEDAGATRGVLTR
jgi:hypothetical protein